MKLISSKLSYLPIIEKITAVLPTVFVNYTNLLERSKTICPIQFFLIESDKWYLNVKLIAQ